MINDARQCKYNNVTTVAETEQMCVWHLLNVAVSAAAA